ncbi:MAG: hypothetical protein AAB198_01305 [Actinomycetota bacterium]
MARRPDPADQLFIASVLHGPVAHLFALLPAMDQAHSVRTARAVEDAVPARTDLVRAALLHDVGKAHAGLGVWGRSVASLLAMFHLPVTAHMRIYLEHGALGSIDLVQSGEAGIVVAFADGHRSASAPPGIDTADWAVLRRADDE